MGLKNDWHRGKGEMVTSEARRGDRRRAAEGQLRRLGVWTTLGLCLGVGVTGSPELAQSYNP